MAEDKFNFLEDSDGNKSSKRLWGSISIGCGILLSFILFIYFLFMPTAIMDNCLRIIEALFYIGAVLLGLGVAEPFFGKK